MCCRYHIHQYNIDEVMQCVLPYHETRIFVRVIQLLPIAEPTNKWHWLKAAALSMKADSNFTRYTCAKFPVLIRDFTPT